MPYPCHVLVMVSVMNGVHQQPQQTLLFLRVTSSKNGKYLSFNLHYFEDILKSVVDSCILNDAEWTLPHSVRCLHSGMSPPGSGENTINYYSPNDFFN